VLFCSRLQRQTLLVLPSLQVLHQVGIDTRELAHRTKTLAPDMGWVSSKGCQAPKSFADKAGGTSPVHLLVQSCLG